MGVEHNNRKNIILQRTTNENAACIYLYVGFEDLDLSFISGRHHLHLVGL